MNIMDAKVSVRVQINDHPGFYFDVELNDSPDGMVFEGWLYNNDFGFKSHIYSIEAIKDDKLLDWFSVAWKMNGYIEVNNLIDHYWDQIELLEYK